MAQGSDATPLTGENLGWDVDLCEGNSSTASSQNEVEQSIQETARTGTLDLSSHGNLTFLPLHWLHEGPRAVKGAVAVNVHRHSDGTYKGTYLNVEFWRRQRQSDPYRRADRVIFGIKETEKLLTYLRQAEATAGAKEGQVVILPAAEIFDNLNESQQHIFQRLE